MRKWSRLSLLFLCILTLFVGGCGGGSGSSADPMGTGTVQFIDEKGAILYPQTAGNPLVFTVMPGETRQLIVWVTNARNGGATIVPVIGENVTFTLLTPGNGGSITRVNDETDAKGWAVGLYTAGNNFATDEVRVTTGVGATAHVTIMKAGGTVGPRLASLAASPTSVAAGGSSVITATVADGNGNPMIGETVTFTLPVNASGGGFVSSATAVTDASGIAEVIYQAGSNSPLLDVSDTVRATLTNGSSKAVVITRSAAPTPDPTTPLSITVAASPDSVTAGQASIVTATVTGDDNDGVTVTFSLTSNIGSTLSATSAVTDGSGNAVVTYQPGNATPTLTVSDTIRVNVGSISSSTTITRTGTAPLSYNLTISAAPATLATDPGDSVITANLKDTAGTAISGETITFTCTKGNLNGAAPPATATTDGSGNAVVTYTNTAAGPGTATVTATWGAYSNSVVINIP